MIASHWGIFPGTFWTNTRDWKYVWEALDWEKFLSSNDVYPADHFTPWDQNIKSACPKETCLCFVRGGREK